MNQLLRTALIVAATIFMTTNLTRASDSLGDTARMAKNATSYLLLKALEADYEREQESASPQSVAAVRPKNPRLHGLLSLLNIALVSELRKRPYHLFIDILGKMFRISCGVHDIFTCHYELNGKKKPRPVIDTIINLEDFLIEQENEIKIALEHNALLIFTMDSKGNSSGYGWLT